MPTFNDMNRGHAARYVTCAYRTVVVGVAAALLGIGIAGSASAQIDSDRGAEREDSKTCERFGAQHGQEYTRCMLEQQRRRDHARLYAAEQRRDNVEAARKNVKEAVRRIQCNRETKRARERGERPYHC